MTLLQAALAYAQIGWRVLPLRPKDKRPANSNGCTGATTDPSQINAWWAENPAYNVGVATGADSGLVVMDVDQAKGGSIDAPPSLTAATGNGYHVYYKHPGGRVPNSASKVAPGVDIRGDGGYVVAPPSVHPSGAIYQWSQDADELTPAPAFVTSAAATTLASPPNSRPEGRDLGPAPDNVINAASDRLARHGPAIEGQGGDQHTFAACAILRHDFALSDGEAAVLLQEWNSTCQPPWNLAELFQKYENAGEYAKGVYGSARAEVEATDVMSRLLGLDGASAGVENPKQAEISASVDAFLGTGAKREPLPDPEPFSATDAEPDEPETWLISSLLDYGQFVGLIGQAKSAKTWAIIHLAAAIASGRPAFNDDRFMIERPGPVVLLLREDIKVKAKRRIRAEIRSLGLPPDEEERVKRNIFVWYANAVRVQDLDEFKAFVYRCSKCKPVAVFLDPLKKLHSANENSSEEMEPIMDRFLCMRHVLDCTVVLSHHMGKPNENTNKTRSIQLSRGSSTIGDSFEGQIAFSDTDDSDAPKSWTNTVSVMAKNGGSVPAFSLRLEVEDDDQKRAERTSWTVSRDLNAGSTDKDADAASIVLAALKAKRREAEDVGAQSEPLAAHAVARLPSVRLSPQVVRRVLLERLAPVGQVEEIKVRGGRGWVATKEAAPHVGPTIAGQWIEEKHK